MTHKLYDGFFIGISSLLVFLVGSNVYPIVIGQGSLSVQLGLLTLLPMLAVVILYFGPFLRGARAAPEITMVVVLVLITAIWSYLPANTIERAVPLFVTTAFAMTLGSVLSLRSLILVLALVGALSMFGSILVIVAVPGSQGIPPWENTWNGVFNHKNGLGSGSLWALIYASGAAMVTTKKTRMFYLATSATALFLLIASESRSPQFMMLLIISALLFRFFKPRFVLTWALFFLILLIIMVAIIYFMLGTEILDPVFDSLNRKPTLSGRIPIWGLVLPYIQEEFWLGYGYLGFWDKTSDRVLSITYDLGLEFTPYYSHNGLLETWLNVGFFGVMIMIAALVRAFRSSFIVMQNVADNTLIIITFLVVITFLMLNITESLILSRSSLSWMSFVAVVTKISLVARTIKKKPEKLLRGFGEISHRKLSNNRVKS